MFLVKDCCAMEKGMVWPMRAIARQWTLSQPDTPTAKEISFSGKVTPVGFEPTPLRNGALSHRLRPLGQSVLGTTFWQRNSCYTAVLGDLPHKSRYLWARRRTPISQRARPRITATIREGRLLEGSSVLLELRHPARFLVMEFCAVAWGMMRPMRAIVQQ